MTEQKTIEDRVREQIKQQTTDRESKMVGLIVAKLQAEADLALIDEKVNKKNFDKMTEFVESTQEQIETLAASGIVSDEAITEVVQQLEAE